MRYFRPNQDIRAQKKMLKEQLKFPYVMKATNTRVYLDSQLGSYMTDDNKIPMRELGYIDRVKQHIIKNNLYQAIPKVKETSIHYFRYAKRLRPGFRIKDCFEVDMKSAYWEMTNNHNLLDPSLYILASKINPDTKMPFMSKETRLAAIGALARRQRVYTFDGEKEIMTRHRSKETEHIWDYICFKVGRIMREAEKAAGKDFVFFWVDACFVSSAKARDRVIKVFQKHKYDFTEIDIKDIQVVDDKVHVEKRKKIVKKKFRKFPFAPHKQN